MLIYALDVSNLNPDDIIWKDKVSKKRYDKSRNYILRNDRALSLGAELLLNYALKENFYIKIPIEYKKNNFGKPYLADYPQIFFNLSHSEKYSVCALSDYEIGIDIQLCKRMDLKIAKRFFHIKEYNYLTSYPASKQLDLFYEMWTLKESYVKAKGLSSATTFKQFYIDKAKNIEVYYKDEREELFFRQYDFFDDSYKLSVCCMENNFADKIELVRTDCLLLS